MRRFVRHPSSIPIELSVARGRDAERTSLHNISTGGLACVVPWSLSAGCPVVFRIPMFWPEYRSHGVVAWCRPWRDVFEVGIQFSAQDVFKVRMVEQLSQIESYRQQVLVEQGRTVDGEQAAREWITLHAGDFATIFPSSDESR